MDDDPIVPPKSSKPAKTKKMATAPIEELDQPNKSYAEDFMAQDYGYDDYDDYGAYDIAY